MITVGLPYTFSGLTRMDEITGGAPYGATTLAGADGSRQPSENELDGARFQGRQIAEVTNALLRGRNQKLQRRADGMAAAAPTQSVIIPFPLANYDPSSRRGRFSTL